MVHFLLIWMSHFYCSLDMVCPALFGSGTSSLRTMIMHRKSCSWNFSQRLVGRDWEIVLKRYKVVMMSNGVLTCTCWHWVVSLWQKLGVRWANCRHQTLEYKASLSLDSSATTTSFCWTYCGLMQVRRVYWKISRWVHLMFNVRMKGEKNFQWLFPQVPI